MASTTLQSNNTDENDPFVIRRTWSSEEEDTTMAGSNRDSNEQEMAEILIKWQLPGNLTLQDAKKQINALLAELLMCYPDEVTLVDTRRREWSYDVQIPDDKFIDEFAEVALQLHPVRNKQQKVIKWVTVTKFHTTKDLQEWKNNDYFYSQMLEAKVYMFPHPFNLDQWDVSSVGFIRDIHVAHITPEHLHTILTNIMKKQETEVPTFQLLPQRITNTGKTATTRAYSVQCLKTDAKHLIHLLTHGEFRTKPMFIPFRYKTTQPEVFTTCIRRQNEVYHKTWVIKVEGITEEAMEYIRSDITQLNGVYDIVPTKRIKKKGEWKILVDNTKCSFVHKQLSSRWTTLVERIPEDVKTTMPPMFTVPRISSQKVREYQDESSDNDSYGSILTTGTEASNKYEDTDTYNEPPEQYNYPSYASATAATTTSNDSPQMSSPTVSATGEWHKEKQDLEEKIHREKQDLEAKIREQASHIQRIEADLQEKIIQTKDMADQLAQAIDLAHSRDARHEELLQKFELLMTRLTDSTTSPTTHLPPPPLPYQRPEGVGQAASQVTPPTRTMNTQSPPPKKSNQNSTPTKPMYPVFRPIEGSTSTAPISKHKRPQALLTQPTASPEDINEPNPGVQAGKTTK